MCGISVKITLILVVFVSISTWAVADERINLRLNQKRIDDRIATPRLALGAFKEKDKEEELQVTKKLSTSTTTTKRVSKDDQHYYRKIRLDYS
jgi:hypothetical protein